MTGSGRSWLRTTDKLPEILPDLAAYREALRPKLEALENAAKGVPHHRQVAAILLYHDRPTPDRAAALRRPAGVRARPARWRMIANALATHPEHAGIGELRRLLLRRIDRAGRAAPRRFVLAVIEPGFASGLDAESTAPRLAEALLAEPQTPTPTGSSCSDRPPGSSFDPIGEICCDPSRDPTIQATATARVLTEAGRRRVIRGRGGLGFLHEVLAETRSRPRRSSRRRTMSRLDRPSPGSR